MKTLENTQQLERFDKQLNCFDVKINAIPKEIPVYTSGMAFKLSIDLDSLIRIHIIGIFLTPAVNPHPNSSLNQSLNIRPTMSTLNQGNGSAFALEYVKPFNYLVMIVKNLTC